jgi:hypothetical protein
MTMSNMFLALKSVNLTLLAVLTDSSKKKSQSSILKKKRENTKTAQMN